VVLLLIGGAIAARAGWIHADVPRPAGPGPWLIARATGFTAFAGLSLEVILGLLTSTGLAARGLPRAARVELHRWLSPLVLALIAGHAAALLADGAVRFDAVDLLVPLAAPVRPVAIGLGIVALYLAVVVHVSFAVRRRIGTRTWRRLHHLSFAGFALATVHGVAAGTDAGRPWAVALFGGPLLVVVALVVVRARRVAAASRSPAGYGSQRRVRGTQARA